MSPRTKPSGQIQNPYQFGHTHTPTSARPPHRRLLAGNVSLIAIGMVAIFGTMLSFTVSTGEILVKQQQLQDIADATALAGAAALRDGDDALQAVANAADLVDGFGGWFN